MTSFYQNRVVEILLDKGADVNAITDLHGPGLYEASATGDVQILQMLLDKGADVDARHRWRTRSSALQVAAYEGHNRIIEILLENGADATGALQEAAGKGHEKTVQILLEHGVDVNARDKGAKGLSALQVAAIKGHNRVIEILLKHGADATGALQEATGKRHGEAVQTLLEHGVDVNNAECEYGSALLVAVVVGNRRIAEALLDQTASILAKGGCSVALNALEGASRCGYD